ncbi:acyltransferase [Pedobacter sp. SYSU D00535]|uniref:acyltransferase n=1 Tax=Pedobacter sp. SYSU D00535 TaxID=2810308 RepID=UPI001A97A737|nr:acyltransferase [Pedobacter sp. SYSU D00535]
MRLLTSLVSRVVGVRAFHAWSFLLSEIYTQAVIGKIARAGDNIKFKYPSQVKGLGFIEIGDNFSALERLRLDAVSSYNESSYYPRIIIGNNVSFNQDCHVACISRIVIGDNVLVGSKVFISDHYHGDPKEFSLVPPALRKLYSKGDIEIGCNVWIGEGVAILSGVKIGENVIIGANSVVTRDLPSNCVVAGAPAKILYTLAEE